MKEQENYFESYREVKWCPGCGNYAILKTMQKTLFSLNIDNKNVVFVSGIGCSGRFPYYINANGFHTLHGRSPAVITGLKAIRPDLLTWLVIGDGDGFSIGLGHILHMVRKNMNIKILFINNKIYALTKGQYSPTSDKGFISKSSPYGSAENPINPLLMVLNAGCTFVARAIDSDFNNLKYIIEKSIEHKGTAFIEVLQNCNIFNNGIYEHLSDLNSKNERILKIENNKKLTFGNNEKKFLGLNDQMEIKISENEKDLFLTPEYKTDKINILQSMLAEISYNEIPFPIGIFRKIEKPVFFEEKKQDKQKNIKEFKDLFL